MFSINSLNILPYVRYTISECTVNNNRIDISDVDRQRIGKIGGVVSGPTFKNRLEDKDSYQRRTISFNSYLGTSKSWPARALTSGKRLNTSIFDDKVSNLIFWQ